MLIELFKIKQECPHDKITPEMDSGYCPDCGEYIENQWYITRCACCGVKQKTIVLKDQVSADMKFCRNCGNNSFVIEKLGKINFVDVHYAALIKRIVKNIKINIIQTWVDRHENVPVKLISKQGL